MDGSISDMAAPAVEVAGLGKNYGRVAALKSVDLAIEQGGYFALLGPSGGGKTTLLRAIGGFLRPTRGRVRLMGRDVTELAPNARPTGMVFQSYALFPHMTVAENVAYGLKIRKLGREERRRAAEAGLEQVGLSGYGARRIWELSGGQQQRVQLARALVLKPAILLLDEPLAALDAKLRKDMCYELKRLQEAVGVTFIHVTHNQQEAMTVADRIAVIADGELVEVGAPSDVYERPQKRFTADFIGENNLFDGAIAGVEGGFAALDAPAGRVLAPLAPSAPAPGSGAKAAISIRSEKIALAPAGSDVTDGDVALDAVYAERIYLGLTTQHMVRLSDGRMLAVRSLSDAAGDALAPGDAVTARFRAADARLHLA
ncbi:MAG: ABC transporter ATP-binding protein [Pseudomonadota bacterium]